MPFWGEQHSIRRMRAAWLWRREERHWGRQLNAGVAKHTGFYKSAKGRPGS